MSICNDIPTIPFLTEVFNHIRTLEAADKALQQSSPETLNKLRGVLITNNQNDKFGFSLLHRHFPLKQHQILVELNNVTTPWTVSDKDINKIQANGFTTYKTGKIVPTSWSLVKLPNNSFVLMPFEFTFIEGGSDANTTFLQDKKYAKFLDEAVTVLVQSGLQGHMALTLLPDVDIDGATETTVGEANILRLRGEHNVASPFNVSDCKHPHEIQASLFWPTGEDGKASVKAKGSKCDSMETCKCTVKDAPSHEHHHEVQASFFWPTGQDGKIPVKAKGSKCDSMETCKCTVKDAPAHQHPQK